MAIIGIQTDRKNPAFTIADFTFWMPQFKQFMDTDEGQTMFDNLYEIANAKSSRAFTVLTGSLL